MGSVIAFAFRKALCQRKWTDNQFLLERPQSSYSILQRLASTFTLGLKYTRVRDAGVVGRPPRIPAMVSLQQPSVFLMSELSMLLKEGEALISPLVSGAVRGTYHWSHEAVHWAQLP